MEPSDQSTDSVFDFLYNDSRRVGSYLAQMDANGLLTEIRKGEAITKGAKRGFNVGGSFLGTGGNLEITPKEGGGESFERVYDPFWTNARALLDALDERQMIHRDLTSTPIGGVVLVSGRLKVIDLGLIKGMWQLPTFRKLMLKGMKIGVEVAAQGASRQVQRAQDRRKAEPELSIEEDTANLMLEIMPILPHSLNVTVSDARGQVWATLKEEHIVGSGSDLVLKHGVSVPGDWHMLGILDAKPDLGGQADIESNGLIDFTDPRRLFSNSMASQIADIASPVVRMAVGRPASHYAATALMIFREVGQAGI